jgi:hypothetical protein
MQSQQIREPKPHTVTPTSSRYPQKLCVLTRFWHREGPAPRLIPHSHHDKRHRDGIWIGILDHFQLASRAAKPDN